MGLDLKIRKAKQPTRETFYLYPIFKLKEQDPIFTNSQIPQYSEFLSLPLYISLSTQPYPVSTSLVLGLNVCDSQVLRSPLCELCLSFRQIQSCAAQGGLELREILLPLFPVSWD